MLACIVRNDNVIIPLLYGQLSGLQNCYFLLTSTISELFYNNNATTNEKNFKNWTLLFTVRLLSKYVGMSSYVKKGLNQKENLVLNAMIIFPCKKLAKQLRFCFKYFVGLSFHCDDFWWWCFVIFRFNLSAHSQYGINKFKKKK